jgi:glycosyltransferase involved in cell wall biosynthesis
MISAVVLTKNGKEKIKECLAGLKWCDEIVVIDDNSTDGTEKIAKKEGARVFSHSLNDDFASQRNFALEKAQYDWIFFVDDDERVTAELAEEIQKKIKTTRAAGFSFKRIDNFLGYWLRYGEIGQVRLIRLARRGTGEWRRRVDEKWEVRGKTETLKNPLRHYPHPTLTQFLIKINERSTLNAQVFYEEGKRLTLGEWLKPKLKFIDNYFFRLGFLDGVPGFVFGVLMSLHSFAVRVKLYLIWRREGGWR